MKKGYFCILIILLMIIYLPLKADNLVKINNSEEKTVAGNVLYKKENITTTNYNSSTTHTDNINSIEMSPSSDVDIVTWSYQAQYKTTNVSLDKIAENYELHHPGYIVIGGVNSEGWWSDSGYNQISNLFVQDYDIQRSGVSSESFKELIGFYEDNTHIIKRFPLLTDHMILRLYNDNEDICYDVENLNTLPEGNEISIITPENTTNLDISGYHCVEGNIEVYRRKTFYIAGTYQIGHAGSDGILLKGSVAHDYNDIIKVQSYKFYLVTKDENKIKDIKASTSLRCMYEFQDEFKNCRSVTGYMFKLIEDGVVITPDDYEDNRDAYVAGYTQYDDSFYYKAHSYVTSNSKCRCGIGFKEDGSIILMTASKNGEGPSQYGFGNIFKERGCINAYQFDGGSSVCLILRNANGGFDSLVDNYSKLPSIATGIFFVIKDIDYKAISSTRDSISFSINNKMLENNEIKDLVLHIGDQEYMVSTPNFTAPSLDEDTTYEYYFTYKILKNGTYVNSRSVTRKYTTLSYQVPDPKFEVTDITKTSIKIIRNNTNYYYYYDIIVHLNAETFMMGDKEELIINDLIEETAYNFYIEYSFKDPDLGRIYTKETEPFVITTLNYEKPSIEYFEIDKELLDGKIRFKFKYLDPDRIVTKAYVVCCYEVSDDLNVKMGTVSFNDVTNNGKAYLVIKYIVDDIEYELKSEEIEIEVPIIEDIPIEIDVPKKKCGKKSVDLVISLISLSTIFYVILKKKS